jgi:predicted transcriptional regulator
MATKIRSVRINDKLWAKVQKKAEKKNTDVSKIINEMLADWVQDA